MAKTAKQFLAEFGNRVGVLANTVSISNNVSLTQGSDLIMQPTSGVFANGSFGQFGQVLTSNGSAVYWNTSGGGGAAVGNYGAITVNSTTPSATAWSINKNVVTPDNLSAGAPTWIGSGNFSLTGASPILGNVTAINSGKGQALFLASAVNSTQIFVNNDTSPLNVAEFNSGGLNVKTGGATINGNVSASGIAYFIGGADASFYRSGSVIGFGISGSGYCQLQGADLYIKNGGRYLQSPPTEKVLSSSSKTVNVVKEEAIDKIRNFQSIVFSQNDKKNINLDINKIENVLPEIIREVDTSENKDGSKITKMFSYDDIVPLLCEAVKYLDEENRKLKSKVDSLLKNKS